MKKNKLLDIISKYSCNGRLSSIRFIVDDENALFISAKPIDKSFLVEGNFKNFELPACEIGIYDTDQLKACINAADDEFKLSCQYERNKITSLIISDTAIDINFCLADIELDVFEISRQKSYPDTHVKFELNRETMERFIRSKTALKDATNVAIVTDEDVIDLIIGYSDVMSNTIKLSVNGEVREQLSIPMQFNADVIKDIFIVNKNATSATFELSLSGLLTLNFSGDDWNTKFLLQKLVN